MKIVICGGGTAGWIAAYIINETQFGVHDITVIESSKIGIIGAGEGSTGSLIDLLSGFYTKTSIDINDFIEKTDATRKMGIRHVNWTGDGSEYFAPLDGSPSAFNINDYYFKYGLYKFGKEKIHLSSKIGIKYENKIYDEYNALHFDGHKVGEYFKNICMQRGVKLIDSVIENVNSDENKFVRSIQIEDNKMIEADFFIDCTGFSNIFKKAVGNEWISYQEFLPVNTAMPFIVHYDENEEVIPETKAVALSSGWSWNIPLKTRRGCGYVYDKNYISEDEAIKEVESLFNKKIEPIKFINFDSGHLKYFWKNNVISFGLSSSFVEPLEATSIHNTIIQIVIFANDFLKKEKQKTIVKKNQDLYNERVTLLNNLTIDFISMHYQGGRSDTRFWKDIKTQKKITPTAEKIINYCKNSIPGYILLQSMYGGYSIPLANWIFAGMEIISPDQAFEDLNEKGMTELAEQRYFDFYNSIVNKKRYILEG